MACKAEEKVRLRNGLLPLKDMFRNREIEINIDLSELKILFEAFKLSQITTTTII
jgi:hypothetical protein